MIGPSVIGVSAQQRAFWLVRALLCANPNCRWTNHSLRWIKPIKKSPTCCIITLSKKCMFMWMITFKITMKHSITSWSSWVILSEKINVYVYECCILYIINIDCYSKTNNNVDVNRVLTTEINMWMIQMK
jgi:hypothetical protein